MSVDVSQLEFEAMEGLPSWYDFKYERAELEGVGYLRKGEDDKIYREVTGDGYRCIGCSGTIKQTLRAHPIHDGPFPLSGTGKCGYEPVPYCPNCEEKPDSNGSFITIPWKDSPFRKAIERVN